jgi:hypothetical protein
MPAAAARARSAPILRTLTLAVATVAALTVPAAPSMATAVSVPATVSATVDGFTERADGDERELEAHLAEQLDTATGTALDSPVGEAGRELGVRATASVRTPIPFTAVSFELPEGAAGVHLRTMGPEGWSAWEPLEAMDLEDGPDDGSPEAAGAADTAVTEMAWVGEATHLEIATPGDVAPAEVTAHLADTLGLSESPWDRVRRLLAPARDAVEPGRSRPEVVSRSQWGADESWRRGSPTRAQVGQGIVHHTATSNGYSREDAPAIVRAIYHHHTRVLGWADIGYNILVDRFGRVYEGRAGGLESGVVGAHARGHNTGTFGVAAIGNHDVQHPSEAAVDALKDVVAWQFDTYGIDPDGSHHGRSTLIGHLQVGQTACPGRYLQPRLDEIRRASR